MPANKNSILLPRYVWINYFLLEISASSFLFPYKLFLSHFVDRILRRTNLILEITHLETNKKIW